ncbi:hypothetical protein SKAU_G00000570 [Synaphobranchus kaupii]|uniref:Interleukin-1 n=1 Tax=Synaphobranchus kaupii TaxID=118154 RepID=A0A9Q1G851_SYNKA|nr:hypothetical protein SKAU_G00000570 [Synaphobranchus kaupii]
MHHLYEYYFTKTRNMEFKAVCIDLEKTHSFDHKGLQLEVIQHPHSLRHVANLIVALQRMKPSHTPLGTEFSDDDLINIMLENVIEEHDTLKVLDTVHSKPSVFSNTTVEQCSVCDRDQKSLVLKESPLELQAVILQGGSIDLKVNLHLATYKSRTFTDSARRPVALSIAGRNLYLSCSKSAGSPILQLEEVKDRKMLKTINAEGDMGRFLFLRREQGFAGTSLESLKFRGWFISTAVENKMPVEMCEEASPARFTTFSIKTL